MLEKLKEIEDRYEELNEQLGDPDLVRDQVNYRKLTRTHAELSEIVTAFRRYKSIIKEIDDAKGLLVGEEDEQMKALAKEEIEMLNSQENELIEDLKRMLLPKDPNDEKNVIIEIRAGTGGEEAALFAQEIYRMYARFAEKNGWKVEILSSSPTGLGGLKEIIIGIEGTKVFSHMKYEGGVHRVQRVPVTEAQGRIHTSAVTVAVLPEASDVEIDINEKEDLRIDAFCSSGPGGQSVNTTYSAVRITHLSSNLVVTCQDEKSWHKNKAKAMKVLRSRLFEIALKEQQASIALERRSMVGSGDRSEKVRTYNYPQGRVTDHRIGLTLHRLQAVLDGDIHEIIDTLVTHFQAERLKAETGGTTLDLSSSKTPESDKK
ncbi:peptide chain release factor 1 [Acidobacteriota bacterium]